MAEGNNPGHKPDFTSSNCPEARDTDTDSGSHSHTSSSVSFMSTSSTMIGSDVTSISRSPSMFSIQSSNAGRSNGDDAQSLRSNIRSVDNVNRSSRNVLRLNNEPNYSTVERSTSNNYIFRYVSNLGSFLLTKDRSENDSYNFRSTTYYQNNYSTYTSLEDMFTPYVPLYTHYEEEEQQNRKRHRNGMY